MIKCSVNTYPLAPDIAANNMTYSHLTDQQNSMAFNLTNCRNSLTSQAASRYSDNFQSFYYRDLTESFTRLALSQLAYCNSAVLFFEILQNRLVSKICKLADASASLHQYSLDSHHLFPLLTLTRSVKTSYLSQYLQSLLWTSDILRKTFKHLITFIILTRSHNQPHATLQILRHTRLATGTNSWLKNRDTGRIASPGNVT